MGTLDVAQEFPMITVKPTKNKTIKEYMGIPNTELSCYMKILLSSFSYD
jgi:hypothetical protein